MNLPESRWAQEQLEILDSGWERCMSLISSLGPDGLETNLTSSWTIKEMIAHLAFWEEVSLPIIQVIHRGGPDVPIAEWCGGTDLELSADVPWPAADTHNAREARWARSKSSQEVLSRLITARQKLKSIVATVTTAESQGPLGEQWSGNAVCRHIDHHLQQIRDLSKEIADLDVCSSRLIFQNLKTPTAPLMQVEAARIRKTAIINS